jgi:hypothetical protein
LHRPIALPYDQVLRDLSGARIATGIAAQAPIPRTLVEPKTAFLVNEGAGQGTYDDLANALRKWGRFTLVDDPDNADITITLGGLKAFKGWPMTITKTGSPTALWSDKAKKGLTKNVADSLVKKLRQRLEAKS